jgi:hypothetical protein
VPFANAPKQTPSTMEILPVKYLRDVLQVLG